MGLQPHSSSVLGLGGAGLFKAGLWSIGLPAARALPLRGEISLLGLQVVSTSRLRLW